MSRKELHELIDAALNDWERLGRPDSFTREWIAKQVECYMQAAEHAKAGIK